MSRSMPSWLQRLQRVVDDGQRGQRQEVHLQQTDLFHVGHRIHGRDFILARLVERNELRQRSVAKSRRRPREWTRGGQALRGVSPTSMSSLTRASL